MLKDAYAQQLIGRSIFTSLSKARLLQMQMVNNASICSIYFSNRGTKLAPRVDSSSLGCGFEYDSTMFCYWDLLRCSFLKKNAVAVQRYCSVDCFFIISFKSFVSFLLPFSLPLFEASGKITRCQQVHFWCIQLLII